MCAFADAFRRHVVHGTLQCYKYHGPDRKLPRSPTLPYHVVLSTYGTIASDFSGERNSVLDSFRWYRLILDEGGRLLLPCLDEDCLSQADV